MVTVRYRPPRDCPVCRHRLDVTQLGCPQCGTGLSGQFQPCEYCGLDDGDRDLLRVFLVSRGNMKELERHLGVSYPTARARFDDLLRRLGLDEEPDAPGGSGDPPEPEPEPDPRLDTLEALARGQLSVDDARRALRPKRGSSHTKSNSDG